MAKWVFGFIAVCLAAFSVWVIQPFLGIDDPISVNISKVEKLKPLTVQSYPHPSDFSAGKAYRLARAKRVMAPEARYPVEIVLRYNNALEQYMQDASGRENSDAIIFPQFSDLRSQDVLVAMMRQAPCQGVERKLIRRSGEGFSSEVKWVTASNNGKDRFGRAVCKTQRSNAHMSKHLQVLVEQNLNLKLADCTWERISSDSDILDMLTLYKVEDNAAYLCLMTLQSKAYEPFETAGYFTRIKPGEWVYLGGFPDVRAKLRNIYLDPEVLKNPEAAARMRWSALQ